MKTWLVSLLSLFALSTQAVAQTPPIDDCPAGHVLHPSLTKLDDATLTAAATASYIGTHGGQLPCNVRGCGDGDIANWVSGTNHYGPYGDDVCRAGWNLYRERQIGRQPTGPTDGDEPARFLPSSAPPVPTPVPVPPMPSINDWLAIKGELDMTLARLDTLNANIIAARTEIQATRADVNDGRAENRAAIAKVGSFLADNWKSIVAIVGPALGTYLTCHASNKC